MTVSSLTILICAVKASGLQRDGPTMRSTRRKRSSPRLCPPSDLDFLVSGSRIQKS